MNEKIILDMISPYLKDSLLTYTEFENIFSMLSIREQYGVIDILYKNNIELVDSRENKEELIDEIILEDNEGFEVLYDDSIFENDTDIELEEDKKYNSEFLKNRKNVFMSNYTLIQLIQQGNEQACQDLCIKNKGLVEKWAGIYNKTFGNKLDFEDLKQAGMLGMIKAAKKFDLTRNYEFSTYALYWIKQSIVREIYDSGFTVRIPVHMMENINKVVRNDILFAYEENYFERIKLISDRIELPVAMVEKCLRLYHQFIQATSLDTPVGEEEDATLGDFVRIEDEILVEDIVSFKFLQEQLTEVLDTLTEREQKVIRLRFGLDDGRARTLDEVGVEYGVTRERIRQIEAKALRKLRHPSRSRKLKDYLD